jgi:hypothetical protein
MDQIQMPLDELLDHDDDAGISDDFDDFDLDEVRATRRLSLVTSTLLVVLVAVLAFAGGATVVKNTNGTNTSAVTGAGQAARLAGGGAGGGGFGGGAAAGTATGTVTGGTASTSTAGPPIAVVGTVTSLTTTTMKVKNLGGKTVAVKLPTGTRIITVTTATGTTLLATGKTVSVTGTTAADGIVTASTVTVQAT